nr:MAG TPA: hypothetical protein [Caudoviricetes sp.]
MTFAEAAMIMMSDSGGSSGKVKPITITKNGDYTLSDDDKNAGYIGYTPVYVNVTDFDKQSVTFTKNGSYSIDSPIKYAWNPIIVNVDTNPIINSLSVSEPGTYHAYSYSCNGFDPVIVSDKYKKLYEQAKGNGENIDTGITDKDGNEITLDNSIETTWTGWDGLTINNEVAVVDPKTSVKVRLYTITEEVNNTQTGAFLEYQKCLQVEMTNLKTGDVYSSMATRYWYTSTTASGISLINFRIEKVHITLGELQVEGNTYSGNEKVGASKAYFAWYLRGGWVNAGSFSDEHPVFLQAVYS